MRATNTMEFLTMANFFYTKANEGFSLNLEGNTPEAGYMVSVIDGPEWPNMTSVCPFEMVTFIKTYKNIGSNHYFGIWTDEQTGKVYFDLSVNVPSEKEALEMAEAYHQKAIYDVKNCKDIRL